MNPQESHEPPKVLRKYAIELPASLTRKLTQEQNSQLEDLISREEMSLHQIVKVEKAMEQGQDFDEACAKAMSEEAKL